MKSSGRWSQRKTAIRLRTWKVIAERRNEVQVMVVIVMVAQEDSWALKFLSFQVWELVTRI